MTVLTEKPRDASLILSSEAASFERVLLDGDGADALAAGTAVGRVAASIEIDAGSQNVGTGDAEDLTAGPQIQAGVYTLTFVHDDDPEEGAPNDVFLVVAPDGTELTPIEPDGNLADVGHFSIKITDDTVGAGKAPFEDGDVFEILYEPERWSPPDHADIVDGADSILMSTVDTTAGYVTGYVVARKAELDASRITWPDQYADVDADTVKLAAQGVLFR